jgi:hypothetical protein
MKLTKKQQHKTKFFGKYFAGFLSITLAGIFVFFFARHQALSATVTRPGAASTNVQIFAFTALSGTSEFDVVSLPETQYTDGQPGSAIFTAYDGASNANNYMNLAHMGQNSETSDAFLLQFFNQTQCITGRSGKPQPGNMKEVKFNATFVKPNLSGSSARRITIRAYDHFKVTWGDGQFSVTIRRFWRAIDLPQGKTADTFSPNDYYNDGPRDSDVESSGFSQKTLLYDGEFAPYSTRITHGQPYDSNTFARPASVKVDNDINKDFDFYDIKTTADDVRAVPDKVLCQLDHDTVTAEKTQPCGCLNNADTKTCGDPAAPFTDLWPPLQYSVIGGTEWQVNSIADLRDSIASYGEQFANDGQVRLEINSYDATQNTKYNAVALPLFFHNNANQLYFSWCFNGKSQQGLVAGGDWITETQSSTATLDADSSGCCDLVTRTPEVDKTGADSEGRPNGVPDGVDDNWQLKYGFKLTGKEGYMLPANYDDDPSGTGNTNGLKGDGYIADQFLDLEGQPIAITPGSVNSKTGSKYHTGDGDFTAAEEYIWGTDPTEYDSDLDGYPDEADIVGIGQKSLDFVSQLQPRDFPNDSNSNQGNDRFDLKVKVLGETDQKRSETENPQDAQTTSGLELQNVVRLTEDEKDIFAKDPGEMSVSVAASPESPGTQDQLAVTSSLTMGTRAGGNPVFHWFLRRKAGHGNNPGTGQPSGDTAFLEGEGINKFTKTIREICPECQPGDELEISLQVDDTVRGQVASANTLVEIGDENSLQIFQDCNRDGNDEEVGSSTYCFHSDEVTKNIPVRVSANFFNVNPGQFYFQWKVNGILQTSNCLLSGATSTSAPQKCGFGTNQVVFNPKENRKDYPVELRVYKNNREDVPLSQFNATPSVEIAHYTTTISSGIPAVSIVFEPTPPNADDSYPTGTTVTARAIVEFLDAAPKGQLTADPNVPGTVDGAKALRYVWRDANDQIIKVEELASITGSTIRVDGTLPGVAQLSVSVTSPDYVSSTGDSGVTVPISATGIAYFVSGGSGSSLTSALQVRLASLIGFIPAPFVQVIKIVAILTFGTILVIGFASVPRLRKKG